jgi:hypothetical protein|tara:strand:+ start:128 stop:490 length:363 start_codon:yes stop_codon:yes gene_type:complete
MVEKLDIDINSDGSLSIEMDEKDTSGYTMYVVSHTLSLDEVIELHAKCEKVIHEHNAGMVRLTDNNRKIGLPIRNIAHPELGIYKLQYKHGQWRAIQKDQVYIVIHPCGSCDSGWEIVKE